MIPMIVLIPNLLKHVLSIFGIGISAGLFLKRAYPTEIHTIISNNAATIMAYGRVALTAIIKLVAHRYADIAPKITLIIYMKMQVKQNIIPLFSLIIPPPFQLGIYYYNMNLHNVMFLLYSHNMEVRQVLCKQAQYINS
jgi:hypothetical protein